MALRTRDELYRRAARCYEQSGMRTAAIECWEAISRAGGAARAAALYQELGRTLEAANSYRLAERWRDAARCYLAVNQAGQAAECVERSGEHLEAAWLFAHRVGSPAHARRLLAAVELGSEGERLCAELIQARCEAATASERPRASRRVRDVARALDEISVTQLERIEAWGVCVARQLGRPDLIALIYAAGVRARSSGAGERWRAWALAELGDGTGIPLHVDVAPPRRPGRTVQMKEQETIGDRTQAPGLPDPAHST
jgi:tetratricopeptide (TPR) repeat protein